MLPARERDRVVTSLINARLQSAVRTGYVIYGPAPEMTFRNSEFHET